MKMFLVINKTVSDYQIGGLFTNKDASIRRALFLDKCSNPEKDHWIVVEVSRQNIKDAVPMNKVIYDTPVDKFQRARKLDEKE